MNFINKLERRFGRYSIKNLMKYVSILYLIGFSINLLHPGLYQYLTLDFRMIFRGQIWRLITFVIPNVGLSGIFLTAISVFVYYIIGNTLERTWGSFRMNLYFFSGLFFNVIAALITYFIGGFNMPVTVDSINQTLFFALAVMYPDMQFRLYFLIPIKAKHLAIFQGALYGVNIIQIIQAAIQTKSLSPLLYLIPMVASMANFLIFFLLTRDYKRLSPREIQRKATFRRKVKEGKRSGPRSQHDGRTVITRHKCATCGKTELDDEDLEFRFCSKCDGNYEYCMEHLFTHEHVKK